MNATELLIAELFNSPGAAKFSADIPAGADPGALVDLHARLLSHHGETARAHAAAIEAHIRLATMRLFHIPEFSENLARMERNIKAARAARAKWRRADRARAARAAKKAGTMVE